MTTGRGRYGMAGLLTLVLIWAPGTARGQVLEVDGTGYLLGDPEAPIEVVEFGDFACSACAEFWRETWPSVRSELVETGRVSWRHVPMLIGFRRGREAAAAAECAADQDAFWPMHDRLFEHQREWSSARRPDEVFRRFAEELRLDVEVFSACYEDEDGEDRTAAATRAGRRARIRGTPTFFIDGQLVAGAIPFELFLGLVEAIESEGSGGSQ